MSMPLPLLVFDIETVTDVTVGSHLYGLHDLSVEEAEQALHKIRRAECGSDFPRLPLHEIVCISGLWIDQQHFKLFSWTRGQFDEATILSKFIGIFEKRQPTLVSWNGAQFDLPVIMHRCLYHGLSAPSLCDQGEIDRQKRYDNYQNRYHLRHTDLMDVLAQFNGRHVQKLDDMAQVLGLPGKCGISGQQVAQLVRDDAWQTLSCYCESDVINTWLIYLRWTLLRGFITREVHRDWIEQTLNYIRTQPHQQEFLRHWQASAATTAFTRDDFNMTDQHA